MSDQDWRKLVERYRGDRVLCNCRQAWCVRFHKFEDGLILGECTHGCSSNQIDCRNEIAERICAELGF